MYLTTPESSDEVWTQLQQPLCLAGEEPRLRLLLAARDLNWKIEEPVYLRPRWGSSGARVYHFILHRPCDAPRLITVPESPAVEAFIRAEGLKVVVQDS
ncbi:MAG: hypothetical protein NZM11_01560 [Anaerolineales bacterium]|nr:hypothetical protein [Anaerolineales bacterium]